MFLVELPANTSITVTAHRCASPSIAVHRRQLLCVTVRCCASPSAAAKLRSLAVRRVLLFQSSNRTILQDSRGRK
ncbi:hypothetical protein Ancab_016920 [Ancistrocladus abbreviatus]